MMNEKRLKAKMAEMGFNMKTTAEIKEELQKQIDDVPLEVCQEILDLMHSGKTVGEVCKEVKLDTFTVSGVIVKYIGTVSYLKTKAIDNSIEDHENRCSMYNR
jgi:uncharacterized protein YfbU (UPF0304 family)